MIMIVVKIDPHIVVMMMGICCLHGKVVDGNSKFTSKQSGSSFQSHRWLMVDGSSVSAVQNYCFTFRMGMTLTVILCSHSRGKTVKSVVVCATLNFEP